MHKSHEHARIIRTFAIANGSILLLYLDILRGLGFDPGLEMKVAMDEAARRNIPLVLGDQGMQKRVEEKKH